MPPKPREFTNYQVQRRQCREPLLDHTFYEAKLYHLVRSTSTATTTPDIEFTAHQPAAATHTFASCMQSFSQSQRHLLCAATSICTRYRAVIRYISVVHKRVSVTASTSCGHLSCTPEQLIETAQESPKLGRLRVVYIESSIVRVLLLLINGSGITKVISLQQRHGRIGCRA